MRFLLILTIILMTSNMAYANEVEVKKEEKFVLLNYSNFGIKFNCEKRGYEYFIYDTVPDGGNNERVQKFYFENRLPTRCRQFSTETYKSPIGFQKFDRGHGVHQNIWDHDIELMTQTNVMANIVPQDRTLNRSGLWRHLEKVTECFRDINELHVIGGNIWGDNYENDFFLKSHGVVTPDFLYKIILINRKDIFAFIMPNNSEPTYYNGMNYITSVRDIEEKTGNVFKTIPESLKENVERYVPRTPKKCSIK